LKSCAQGIERIRGDALGRDPQGLDSEPWIIQLLGQGEEGFGRISRFACVLTVEKKEEIGFALFQRVKLGLELGQSGDGGDLILVVEDSVG